MRYLDPKNDITFKKVFGEHPHLLKSFLNALLPLEKDQVIESLEYLTPELTPVVPLLKNSVVDVRCKDNKGRQFIVEMQMSWTTSFKQRVLFNASKAYVKQMEVGENFKLLQPVYALNLVNEVFLPEMPGFYHHFKIVHIENITEQIKGLEFIFVELPKFKPHKIIEKKLQVLWLRYLTEVEGKSEEISKDLTDNMEIKEAIDYLKESSFTKEELDYYEKYWDIVSREKTLIEESEEKGEIKGEIKGVIKGVIKVAIKMKQKGYTIEEIIEMTGLSKEEIEKL